MPSPKHASPICDLHIVAEDDTECGAGEILEIVIRTGIAAAKLSDF